MVKGKMEFRTPEGVLVRYVEVTPELAKTLLDANKHNRSISNRLVDQYAANMLSDDWPFTGDSLKCGANGLVLDGQHRLLAIEASGVARAMLVVSDLPPAVQRYLDMGRKRTVGDNLTLEGVSNAASMGAIARLALSWQRWRAGAGTVAPTGPEITEYTLDNLGAMEQAFRHAAAVRSTTGTTITGPAAAFLRAVEVNGDLFEVSGWFARLATGEGLTLGEPLLTVRNTFTRREKSNALVQLYFTARAWNATIRNEPLGKLQPPNDGITTKSMGRTDMAKVPVEDVSEAAEAEAELAQRVRESA